MAPKSPLNLPGRKIAANEKPSMSARIPTDTTFLIGVVVHVDVDRQKMMVNILRGYSAGPIPVNISQPYAGNSSFIQATPEKNSMVLLAHQENDLIPIAYLPNYVMGLENRNIKTWPDNIKTQSRNESFFRLKKLKQGEIALGSKGGVEIFLGDLLKLDDRSGNSFVLRPSDNSIISTANNNYVFSSGVWTNSGIIHRNSINPIDLDDLTNVFREELLDGKGTYVLRPYNSNTPSDPYLTEYLIEVEDRDFNSQPMNDVNFNSNKSIRKPIAIFSLGNYVGNNSNDQGTYGRVLRPVLFTDPDDENGDFSFEPVFGDKIDTLALAMTMYKPERTNPEIGAFFGVDKEGHFFQFIPSATGGNLGKGRSMSILARGSKKEIWGQDSRYGNSWDMKTIGGIKWVIGAHNERDNNPYSNRSMDIRTDSSVTFIFGSEQSVTLNDFEKKDQPLTDVRDYYKIEKIAGKERKEVGSNRETIIRGSDKLKIEGAKVEQIIGANTLNVGSGYNVIVGDAFTEKVTKEKNESFGNRKTIINSGNSELVIKAPKGDIIEEISAVGNKKVKLKTGSIEETIAVGNRKFSTGSGNFEATTKVGGVKLLTKSGQVSFQTKIGKMSLNASLDIDIKTKSISNVNISGGAINIKGRTGVSGGVVTTKTHFDYITGAPLKGSSSVKATM